MLDDLTKIHDLLSDFSSFDPYRLGGYVIALTALALACGAVKLTGRAALWSVRQGWGVLATGWRRLTRTAPQRPMVANILKRMEQGAIWEEKEQALRFVGLDVRLTKDRRWAMAIKVGGIDVWNDLSNGELKAVSLAARKALTAWRERERVAREQLATEALRPAIQSPPPDVPLGTSSRHTCADGTVVGTLPDGTRIATFPNGNRMMLTST